MLRLQNILWRATAIKYLRAFSPKFYCSSQKSTATSSMSPSMQKAILSYYMIRYIRFFKKDSLRTDQRSIRQRLMDRTEFYQYILNNLMSFSGHREIDPSVDQIWLNNHLEQSSFREVVEGFMYSQGALINPKIWEQDRMRDVMSDFDTVILFPTSITQQYFSFISKKSHSVLSGEKGMGKSFSFLTYDYFSKFIISFRLQLPPSANLNNKLAPSRHLKKIPKICYMNLKDHTIIEPYFYQISRQFLDIFPQNQFEAEWKKNYNLQNLKSYLTKLNKKAQEKNVQTVLIIDEANRIFRLFRRLKNQLKSISKQQIENNPKTYFKNLSSFKDLQFYSDLFDLVVYINTTNFSRVILNSSQDYELKHAENLNDQIKKNLKIIQILNELRIFLDPTNKNNLIKSDKTIKFSEYIESQQMQLELYNGFWFQIIQNLKMRDILKQNIEGENQLQLLKEHKKIFLESFLISKDQTSQHHYQPWRNDVRLLHMRKFIENYQNPASDQMILFKNQNNIFTSSDIKPFKQILMKNFKTLKRNIQDNRFFDMVSCLKNFYSKAIEQGDYQAILKHVKRFKQEAQLKINEKGPFYKYACAGIPSFERQRFVSSLGFGYNDTKGQIKNSEGQIIGQGYIRVTTDPQAIIKAISLSEMTSQYAILSYQEIIDTLTKNTQLMNNYLGRVFDNLTYPIFAAQQSFYITIYKHSLKEKIPHNYKISEASSFEGFTKILKTDAQCQSFKDQIKKQKVYPISYANLRKMFSQILQKLRSNNLSGKEFMGFYPIKKEGVEVGFLSNQMIFDNFIMKINGQKNQLDCIFFDWTMGRSKGQENKKDDKENVQIKDTSDDLKKDSDKNENIKNKPDYLEKVKKSMQQILSMINFSGTINASFFIVAPEYYAEQYTNIIKKIEEANKVQNKKISFFFSTFDSKTPFSHTGQINQQLISIVSQIYKRQQAFLKAINNKEKQPVK